MRMRRKALIHTIALIMALTCLAPVTGYVYAEGDSGQTTEPTAAPVTEKNGWYGKYYYQSGKVLKGIKKVDGTWYEFNKKTGKLKRKIGDDMDKKAQKYKSGKKYLVLVSKEKHQVRIYKGKKNKWKRVKKFKCTVGKSSTPTPSGTYRIGSKGRYFNTGTNMRCWYWTSFKGDYLFHSVLYNRNSKPNHLLNGRLGADLSHGCIRLALGNARWLQKKVPSGTKVVIKYTF